ncbi:hypothetical protein M231_07560 [Tremella mesenterica]|uniref:Proteasome activator PA28 C-terminal domain-containing protein n=1 Tax=Tremella mesenterica TaxID=5217 RepID=A0A4Q1B8V5_TREME|nr:hypothetical protein M231_07560 [Tremella mesenterica]
MPSFAKPNGTNGVDGDAAPDMTNVFKNHPNLEARDAMMARYRKRAVDILQKELPGKINHLTKLLEGEQDETSCFWIGHVDTETYKPKLYQPDDPALTKMKLGKITLSTDVANGIQIKDVDMESEIAEPAEGDGSDDEDQNKGVKKGIHWFEVMPGNEVQRELCQIVIQEQEDLHLICQDLKIWLEMEIPLMEDGNSFGADVQGHIIRELNETYKKTNAMQNGCRAHFTDRLKLAQEWARYPNLMDYPAAIAANDRFDHFLLRSYVRSLLICYGGLLTKFERNWIKVISPKGSSQSAGGMY